MHKIAGGNAPGKLEAVGLTLKGSHRQGGSMAQTLVSLMVHIVFSTKGRRHNIRPEVEPELYRYMSGTLKHLASP